MDDNPGTVTASTPEAQPSLPSLDVRHPLRFLLAGMIALGPLSMSLYTPSMPAIAHDLGTSRSLLQASIGFYQAAVVLGQLCYGPISDRHGRRMVLFSGFGLFVVASLICASATSIGWLLVGRILQGLGVTAGAVMARAIVLDLYRRSDLARMMSFIGMTMAVAPALGPILGGQLQRWFGWHANFIALVLAGLSIAVLVWHFLPETNRAPQRQSALRNYATIIGSRRFLGHAGAVGAALGGIFSFHSIAPFVLIDRLGVPPTHYGFYTLFTVSGFFFGALTSNRLAGRVEHGRMIAVGLILATLTSALMLVVTTSGQFGPAGFIAPCVCWTFSAGLVLPNAATGALAPYTRIAGSASALMGAIQIGSGALASLVMARIGGDLAVTFASASAALVLTGGGLYLWGVVYNRHDVAEPAA